MNIMNIIMHALQTDGQTYNKMRMGARITCLASCSATIVSINYNALHHPLGKLISQMPHYPPPTAREGGEAIH